MPMISWIPSPVAAFGRSTATVCARATRRAVTMKMMSNTSVMSTSGVTLMPVIAPPVRALLAAIRRLLHVRQEHVTERLRVAQRGREQALKVVEHRDRRDRDHEPHGCRNQGFGDRAHDTLRREGGRVEPGALS